VGKGPNNKKKTPHRQTTHEAYRRGRKGERPKSWHIDGSKTVLTWRKSFKAQARNGRGVMKKEPAFNFSGAYQREKTGREVTAGEATMGTSPNTKTQRFGTRK